MQQLDLTTYCAEAGRTLSCVRLHQARRMRMGPCADLTLSTVPKVTTLLVLMLSCCCC